MKANTTPSEHGLGYLSMRLSPFGLSLRTRMALGFSVLFCRCPSLGKPEQDVRTALDFESGVIRRCTGHGFETIKPFG